MNYCSLNSYLIVNLIQSETCRSMPSIQALLDCFKVVSSSIIIIQGLWQRKWGEVMLVKCYNSSTLLLGSIF